MKYLLSILIATLTACTSMAKTPGVTVSSGSVTQVLPSVCFGEDCTSMVFDPTSGWVCPYPTPKILSNDKPKLKNMVLVEVDEKCSVMIHDIKKGTSICIK